MRHTRMPLLAALAAAAALTATQALALESYRYDPANSGYVATAVQLPLALLWKYSTDLTEEPIIASPVVGPDTVYFCLDKKVFAVDRMTGEKKWDFDTRSELYSAPLLHEGRLFFVNTVVKEIVTHQ